MLFGIIYQMLRKTYLFKIYVSFKLLSDTFVCYYFFSVINLFGFGAMIIFPVLCSLNYIYTYICIYIIKILEFKCRFNIADTISTNVKGKPHTPQEHIYACTLWGTISPQRCEAELYFKPIFITSRQNSMRE
jgi:hypothetical protein